MIPVTKKNQSKQPMDLKIYILENQSTGESMQPHSKQFTKLKSRQVKKRAKNQTLFQLKV